MCGGTVSSEERRKIPLINLSALSCICPSAPDASHPAPPSLSPPNEGPLCEAHESAAVVEPLMFPHQLSHSLAFVCNKQEILQSECLNARLVVDVKEPKFRNIFIHAKASKL